MTETPAWIAGLMAILIVGGGGAAAFAFAQTNAQVQTVARAAAESIAQNGCYTAGTEAVVQSALHKAGLDPANLAVTATATKQSYGRAVEVRVEYARQMYVLGWQTPWTWRAAAVASDVSTNVVPVQNAPCVQPSFSAATGRQGLEGEGGKEKES